MAERGALPITIMPSDAADCRSIDANCRVTGKLRTRLFARCAPRC